MNENAPQAADLPEWLPQERRAPVNLGDQVVLITHRLEIMATRMAAIEQKYAAIDAMAHDLSILVGGYRWVLTARMAFAWLLAVLIGGAGAIKFIFPSLREFMK